MKQAEDVKTMDMLEAKPEAVKRGRGRPKGDKPAMSSAERSEARAERLRASGVDFLKVQLPVDLLEALDKFASSKDRKFIETKSQVVERVLRAYLMRKRG